MSLLLGSLESSIKNWPNFPGETVRVLKEKEGYVQD